MENDLRAALADMSQFIKLELGESFTGVYTGFARVASQFDASKEAIELYFTVNGKEKSMTSMSLPGALVEAGVQVNDTVTVTKASKKGNTIVWLVQKSKAPQQQTVAAPAQTPVPESAPQAAVDLGDLSDTSEPAAEVSEAQLNEAGL